MHTFTRTEQIDILVNCAGGNVAAATVMPDQSFFKMPSEAMQKVFDLNIIGTVRPSQIFGETMQAAGKGNIINISSMTAQSAVTRVCGYSAAKAAVDNFTKWLAVELATKCGGRPGCLLGDGGRGGGGGGGGRGAGAVGRCRFGRSRPGRHGLF